MPRGRPACGNALRKHRLQGTYPLDPTIGRLVSSTSCKLNAKAMSSLDASTNNLATRTSNEPTHSSPSTGTILNHCVQRPSPCWRRGLTFSRPRRSSSTFLRTRTSSACTVLGHPNEPTHSSPFTGTVMSYSYTKKKRILMKLLEDFRRHFGEILMG